MINHQVRKFTVLLFFVVWGFLINENSYSQYNSIFSANTLIESDFSFKTVELNSTENISGILQFYNGSLYLEIVEPIKQNVLITGSTMTMYYPESNQVIEFFGKTPFDLPIISSILPLFKNDYGLTDIGFIVDDFTTTNDTTITMWIPKERNDQNSDSFFKLIYVSDVLYWVQHNSENNSLDIVTHLSNYSAARELLLPMLITTTKRVDGKEVTETIELKELESSVTELFEFNFEIPDNAKREQYSF